FVKGSKLSDATSELQPSDERRNMTCELAQKNSQSAHGFGASYHAAVQNAVTSGRVSTKGHFLLPKNSEQLTSKYSEHPDLVQLLYILTNSSHATRKDCGAGCFKMTISRQPNSHWTRTYHWL